MNPLLDFSGLPRFAEIRPEHIAPAIEQLIDGAREAMAHAAQAEASWDAFVAPLDDANERLARAWGQVVHLHAVLDSPQLRAAYNENLPKVTRYWTELGQDPHLFARYAALGAAPEFAHYNHERRKVVENALRDFQLGGAELPPEKKSRFAAIQQELAGVSARFAEHLLDATNAGAVLLRDPARLAGLPDDAVAAAREAAANDGQEGWKFTLHMPSWLPAMQYAEDRALRETLYRQSVTRASEFGEPEWDNSPLIARIVRLRNEGAELLGYRNHAEVSLVPKMARTPGEVLAFLRDLARRARPFAERDAAAMQAFARAELGLEALQAWDVAFVSERLRQRHFQFSDHEVKQYFPETQVVPGMFRLVESLYGLRIAQASAPRWHDDVRFFELRDASGELIGQFYTDLYARDTKRGGAWMDEAIARRRKNGRIQTPVAHLNCNFARPAGGKPALFTHDDVITLFHEFGHVLHLLLTRVEELGVSGLSGVEWDAVELPSQFMENFCWEWEVIAPMTRHVDTGASIPRALFERMLAAKNFQAGIAILRQIEFALFDMRLHCEPVAATAGRALVLLDEVRREVAVLLPPEYNRFPNSFAHVFAGGYAAGYYSYQWAEVLSADAYAAFEESGVLDARTGGRFRDEILAVGGSRPAAESFRAFRGRAPQVDALLRHNGMIAA
ncbi:MAG: oligopeptidase A [Betaproteobacteria bacterium RIFCSPLOWO2_02_67_12]|nr:MAG: oligopeptidase A [Betaproteobacteria bacterium RIFCSPLOWO2_02_67_12]OGA31002.1 MAG: oligopeptidase A [Betaproteobacteria bacterium RIFCSPLOWO2_02_FULL_68_150]OGA64961.1 MAG: oligopeptidase A [Betaproteobacteria bacterium RIFCSPLOWO2_12_FULL_67_28]